ncbi:MAG: hypothetical protein IKC58_01360 [Clostridia bacterium]|nr:hypothetical protein [Clostridia bacterium]
MKENRIGTIICAIIAIICLALSIVFGVLHEVSGNYLLEWLTNLAFALLGSAGLSLVICLINYLTIRKSLVEQLFNDLYIFNNDINTQICATRKEKSTENLAKIIGIASAQLVTLAYKAYSIKMGLFKIEKTRLILIDQILSIIEDKHQSTVFSIGQELQKYPEIAEKRLDEHYATVSGLLENELAYKLALTLAKSVKSVVREASWLLRK